MKPLYLWMLARFLILICVCGCEMSQCLLWRVTSLFLSLSKMRSDFLDVTVSIWALLPSAIPSLLVLFIFPHSSRKSWIWNQKWLVLQPVHSVAQSSPNIKDTAPGYTGLFLYSPHVFPELTSKPLLMMTTLFWESHLNGSRKSLLYYLTSSSIRLIWISKAGTCTKAPAEAALEVHRAYYSPTTQFILVSL